MEEQDRKCAPCFYTYSEKYGIWNCCSCWEVVQRKVCRKKTFQSEKIIDSPSHVGFVCINMDQSWPRINEFWIKKTFN